MYNFSKYVFDSSYCQLLIKIALLFYTLDTAPKFHVKFVMFLFYNSVILKFHSIFYGHSIFGRSLEVGVRHTKRRRKTSNAFPACPTFNAV